MRKELKLGEFKGITLISLVITIIVLIILSSVAIYLSLGDNGIFIKAKQAKEETNRQEATDIINLKITTAQMNKYAEEQKMPTLQELADILYEDNEIQYVALEKTVANKEKITVGENTSIFTKLEEYPYEFEINSSLQLASINGMKIADNKEGTVTLTQKQYDDILNRITALENNTSSNTNYSTEEQVIGTWIDGKPLYRKVIIGNMKSDSSAIADISDLNIEFVYSVKGIVEYAQNSKYVDGITYCNSTEWGYIYVTGDCKTLASVSGSGYKDKKVWVTLEYTKKTD